MKEMKEKNVVGESVCVRVCANVCCVCERERAHKSISISEAYFDKHVGAAHSKCWSKSLFFLVFKCFR